MVVVRACFTGFGLGPLIPLKETLERLSLYSAAFRQSMLPIRFEQLGDGSLQHFLSRVHKNK